MDTSLYWIILFNLLSYLLGVGTGLTICWKNKDKLMIKSRSIDNINGIYREQEHNGTVIIIQTVQAQHK